jgi:hypothetical protein
MMKYILGVCIFLFIGCATVSETKKQDLFEITSHSYKQALLFGRYEAASGFRKVQPSGLQAINFKQLKKIKVTNYELITIKVSKEKSLIHQTVEIRYFNRDYMIEKTLVDNQLWRYDAEDNAWYLESGLPDFQ